MVLNISENVYIGLHQYKQHLREIKFKWRNAYGHIEKTTKNSSYPTLDVLFLICLLYFFSLFAW